MFVFCKQKTAYEMRISDWSSDVCSSDLTANGLFTGVVTGFRNGEDLGSATDGTLTFTSIADQFSPVGNYAIDGGGLTATNYVFVQDPGNATALTVIGPVGSVFPPDFVRDPPDNYVYNSNLGSPQMCALVDVMAGTQGREGDTLAREWSRVRSRPNLTNCVQTNRRNGCPDFCSARLRLPPSCKAGSAP